MTRRITDNNHNNDQRNSNRRPGGYDETLQGLGAPCGSCCITMMVTDDKTYDEWKCPVTFPNNQEYVKYCIDYSGAYLRGVNELTGSLLSGWRGFSQLRNVSNSRRAKQIIPLLSLNRSNLPEAGRNLPGETICRQYFEFLQGLANKSYGEVSVIDYSWNENGSCDNGCKYPCENFAQSRKVWIGLADACVCADNTTGDYCECEGSEKIFKLTPPKTDYRRLNLIATRPLGYCDCIQQTNQQFSTFLNPYINKKIDDSPCLDCQCDSALLYTGQKFITVNNIATFNEDLDGSPGRCECDDALNLEPLNTDINKVIYNKSNKLKCKCKKGYEWDKDQKKCLISDNYSDWGNVTSLSQSLYKESGGDTYNQNDPLCDIPDLDGYIEYNARFDINHLTPKATYANVFINFVLTIKNKDGSAKVYNLHEETYDNTEQYLIKLIGWEVYESLNTNPDYLNPINEESLLISRLALRPNPNGFNNDFILPSRVALKNNETFISIKPPSRITIGKHVNRNLFFSGLGQYYDSNLNRDHFNTSNRSYSINYILKIKIEQLEPNTIESITLQANFTDLTGVTLRENSNLVQEILEPANIGPGKTSKTVVYNPGTNNCTPTPTPTPTPTQTPTPTPTIPEYQS